jgi:hypothetical protein
MLYVGSDNILLAQLALFGQFYEINESLFLRRDHPKTSLRANSSKKALHYWFDPQEYKNCLQTEIRWGLEYFKIILKAPLSIAIRTRCLFVLLNWLYRRKRKIVKEIMDM